MINLLDVAAPTIPERIGSNLENIIFFMLGFIIGIVIVAIIKLIKKKKSNK